jgi:hypothetical protein
MKEGLLGGTLDVSPRSESKEAVFMLHAGLDLSRRKVDVCLLSGQGEIVDEWSSPPDADGLRGLAARAAMWGPVVRGVIESMNGARFVHDQLEEWGWDVLKLLPSGRYSEGLLGVRLGRLRRILTREYAFCVPARSRGANVSRSLSL